MGMYPVASFLSDAIDSARLASESFGGFLESVVECRRVLLFRFVL